MQHKKSILTVLLLSVAAISLHAQNLSLGVKAGPNISSGLVKANGRSYKGTNIGFHLGAVADLRLTESISLQPNLLFSVKRAKVEELNGITINLYTIDVPITAVYHYKNFFGGVGPNFSFGAAGNYSYNSEKYNLYDKSNEGQFAIKRFEIGLNVLAGYNISKQLFVSANFTPGINNLFNSARYAEDDTKVKTTTIGISVGYFFK